MTMLIVSAMPTALAATGEVTWTNPPENVGKIKRNDDEDNGEYTYKTNARSTNPPDYVPSVGDYVTFDPGPGFTASEISLFDPANPPDPDPEIVLPFGLSRTGKTPHGWNVASENAGEIIPDVCKTPAPPSPIPIPYPNIGCSDD
jgi:hypothetical protein